MNIIHTMNNKVTEPIRNGFDWYGKSMDILSRAKYDTITTDYAVEFVKNEMIKMYPGCERIIERDIQRGDRDSSLRRAVADVLVGSKHKPHTIKKALYQRSKTRQTIKRLDGTEMSRYVYTIKPNDADLSQWFNTPTITFDRQAIMKRDAKEWTKRDKYRHKELKAIVKELNAMLASSLDIDHATALKDGGRHHPNNMHILRRHLNRSKSSNSCARMTYEQQIDNLFSHMDMHYETYAKDCGVMSKAEYDCKIGELKYRIKCVYY